METNKTIHWSCACNDGRLCATCFINYQMTGGAVHKTCPICRVRPCRDYLLWKIFFPTLCAEKILDTERNSLRPDWLHSAVAGLRTAYLRKHFSQMVMALHNMLHSGFPTAPHSETMMFLLRCAHRTVKINEQLYGTALRVLLPVLRVDSIPPAVVVKLFRTLYDNELLRNIISWHGCDFITADVLSHMCAVNFTRAKWLLPCLKLITAVPHDAACNALRNIVKNNIFSKRARDLFSFFVQHLDHAIDFDLTGVVIKERSLHLLKWAFDHYAKMIQTLVISWSTITDPKHLVLVARSEKEKKWWFLQNRDFDEIVTQMVRQKWHTHLNQFMSLAAGTPPHDDSEKESQMIVVM